MHDHQMDLFGASDDEEAEEDIVPPEMLEAVEKLVRGRSTGLRKFCQETVLDLDQLAEFLKELEDFKPSQDNKLQALLKLLKNDAVLKKHKVIIFTEFMDTARYLKHQLAEAGIDGVEEIDSAVKADRGEIIRRFAPYYNGSSSAELEEKGSREIRVLISTDVLSEGPEPPGRHAAHQLRPALESRAADAAHRPCGPAHEPPDRGQDHARTTQTRRSSGETWPTGTSCRPMSSTICSRLSRR